MNIWESIKEKMLSRYLIIDNRKVKTCIVKEDDCKYKTNGKCYNNGDYKKLGKICLKKCERYEKEDEILEEMGQ